MHIVNEDGTVSVKCGDGVWRTYHMSDKTFALYIKSNRIKGVRPEVEEVEYANELSIV